MSEFDMPAPPRATKAAPATVAALTTAPTADEFVMRPPAKPERPPAPVEPPPWLRSDRNVDMGIDDAPLGADPTACSVCGAPQFSSPGGMTCKNGHGGAPGVHAPARRTSTGSRPRLVPAEVGKVAVEYYRLIAEMNEHGTGGDPGVAEETWQEACELRRQVVPDWLWDVQVQVLDVETTGTSPWLDRVVEVACATFVNGACVLLQQQLVNPGGAMPPDVIGVHGITDDMVRDAPCFADAFLDIANSIGPEDLLCAHNAEFDSRFLAVECTRAGIAMPRLLSPDAWLDTYVLNKARVGHGRYDRGHKLGQLAELFGIPSSELHRAGADAMLAGDILYWIAALMPTDLTLDEVIAWQNDWIDEQAAKHDKSARFLRMFDATKPFGVR